VITFNLLLDNESSMNGKFHAIYSALVRGNLANLI